MIAAFQTLIADLLPAWLSHDGHSAHAGSANRAAPAPYSEAAAAAWLMERERRRRGH